MDPAVQSAANITDDREDTDSDLSVIFEAEDKSDYEEDDMDPAFLPATQEEDLVPQQTVPGFKFSIPYDLEDNFIHLVI